MAKLTRSEFIKKIAPLAIKDMEITDIPASLTIAQACLESADGNSALTIQGNNLFGIKGVGTAGTLLFPTTEYVNGKPVIVQAKFRSYSSWVESINDHSQLFHNGVSWNRSLYKNVIGVDGITAAKEVAKAGYATDPKYADKLINLIYDNKLLQYDIGKTEIPYIDTDAIYVLTEKVNKLSEKLNETDPPLWFIKEFPNALKLLNQKTGTYEFWRAYAIILRLIKQNNVDR